MARPRRALRALLVALALVLAAATTAAGAPTATERIFADVAIDGVISQSYSPSELLAALNVAQDAGAGYADFERAVQDALDHDLGGLDTGEGAAPADPGSADDESGLLPQPRGPGERDQPPWPLLALTALGGLLVLSGAGSSIYRRVNR